MWKILLHRESKGIHYTHNVSHGLPCCRIKCTDTHW